MSLFYRTRRYWRGEDHIDRVLLYADMFGVLPSQVCDSEIHDAFDFVFAFMTPRSRDNFLAYLQDAGWGTSMVIREYLSECEEDALCYRPFLRPRFLGWRRRPRLMAPIMAGGVMPGMVAGVAGAPGNQLALPAPESGGEQQQEQQQQQQQPSQAAPQGTMMPTPTNVAQGSQANATWFAGNNTQAAPTGNNPTWMAGNNTQAAGTMQAKGTTQSSGSVYQTSYAKNIPPSATQVGKTQSSGTSRTMMPSPSGGTVRPSQSGGTVRPSQSGGTVRPSQSGGTYQSSGTVRPSQSGGTMMPSSSGGTVRASQSGGTVRPSQSGTMSSSTAVTQMGAADDSRFPPENQPITSLLRIAKPKYPQPDKQNPEHWYYYTLLRNNTAPGMGDKRQKAMDNSVASMKAKGIRDDAAKQSAVADALNTHRSLEHVSDGPRGALYLLKPGFEHILGAALTMSPLDGRRWTLMGLGEKSIKGYYLLLSVEAGGGQTMVGTARTGFGTTSGTIRPGQTTTSGTSRSGGTTMGGTVRPGTTSSGTVRPGQTTSSGTVRPGQTTTSGTVRPGQTQSGTVRPGQTQSGTQSW